MHKEEEEEGILKHPYKLTVSTSRSWLSTILQNDEEKWNARILSFISNCSISIHKLSNTKDYTDDHQYKERAVISRQEDNVTRDIVTIEQHQDWVNRELAELENRRSGGQA